MNARLVSAGVGVLSTIALLGLVLISVPASASSIGGPYHGPQQLPPPVSVHVPAQVGPMSCNYTLVVTATPSDVQIGMPVEISTLVVANGTAPAGNCYAEMTFHYQGLPMGMPDANAPMTIGAPEQAGDFAIQVVLVTPYGTALGYTMLGVQP